MKLPYYILNTTMCLLVVGCSERTTSKGATGSAANAQPKAGRLSGHFGSAGMLESKVERLRLKLTGNPQTDQPIWMEIEALREILKSKGYLVEKEFLCLGIRTGSPEERTLLTAVGIFCSSNASPAGLVGVGPATGEKPRGGRIALKVTDRLANMKKWQAFVEEQNSKIGGEQPE